MSPPESTIHPTSEDALRIALERLRDGAMAWARLAVADKARLLLGLRAPLLAGAEAWVHAAAERKGLDPRSPATGEDWLDGPWSVLRMARLLGGALEEVARSGRPALGRGARMGSDGRLEVQVHPGDAWDSVLGGHHRGWLRMRPGLDEAGARAGQAAFYQRRDPEGAVCLRIAAGPIPGSAATGVLQSLFVDGQACLLLLAPANAWLAPHLAQAFGPLIERGCLAIMVGGEEVAERLALDPAVAAVHLDGDPALHERLRWGPPGDANARRRQADAPLLDKPLACLLGGLTPLVVVPGPCSDEALAFLARDVASRLVRHGGLDPAAPRVLVLPAEWPQRASLLAQIGGALDEAPTRRALDPGAAERFRALTEGRLVLRHGEATDERLPWALLPELDPARADEPLFGGDPGCGVLGVVTLPAREPAAFLDEATAFCNERLWGTLAASLVIPALTEASPEGGAALQRAIATLRYGTVAIHTAPAYARALGQIAWGGHPSSTSADRQSGVGWAGDPFLLDGIEKSVLRGPLVQRPKPPWFLDHRSAHRVGAQLAALEAQPGWLKIPALALEVLHG